MSFQTGDIVRAKKGGHPYLICYINESCCLVADMTQKGSPTILFALLPRDYEDYARDTDMNCYVVKRASYWMDEKLIFTMATQIRLR